ncbi:hypothetical protein H2200_000285 [Cladophialophora chaetospira]|uniref:ATP-grasp domain-containing protein n=1 Tax=Cladophialophora chaetospira TaxID=386627 RepID=A0AA38XNZ9_9EURO|nr:hypothetical protein H2200_000285 [Cladophialophora chaetospira]
MPPMIELDTTVADLYQEHGIKGPFITSAYCSFALMDLHPEFPRETTFPEDEEPVPYSTDEKERSRLRKMILGLKGVRRVFVVGNMDAVILLGPGAEKKNVEQVFNQLIPQQRPRPKYIELDEGGVQQQLAELTQGKKLIYWRSQGWMRDHNCMVPLDISYELNSKLYLVTSGIRTPASEVVNLTHDVLTDGMLATRKLPFVVKLFLAACGFGTHLVTTEDRRKIMLAAMAEYKKRGGSQVLVSEYVNAKRCDLSAHFVVGAPDNKRNRNNPTIVGIATQSLTPDGQWTGSSIDYGAQDELRNLLTEIICDTTKRLPESFVGWCGVDILIDEQDKQWVVDLNARYTGSMAICLLSGHFYRRLGMRFAECGPFKYEGDADDIYEILARDTGTGKVIVDAVVSIDDGLSMADLIWGGHSMEELAQTAGLIRTQLVLWACRLAPSVEGALKL